MDLSDQQFLLSAARQSILHELSVDTPNKQAPVAEHLQTELACFVTLKIDGKLRGCIGNLEPVGSLYESVCRNAKSAAFQDPRFPALDLQELDTVSISISILSKPQAIQFQSEAELKQQLTIGKHGLIIQTDQRRATFLPAVWENLNNKELFIRELKNKAGISSDEKIESAWIYQTESFSE